MARRRTVWSSLIEASGLALPEREQLQQVVVGTIEDEVGALGALLYAMNPSPYILFLGDGEWILVTPWGCEGSSFVNVNRHTGERLPFVNELMPSRFEISDTELRRFFCMLELALYKLLELHEVHSTPGKPFDKLTLGDLRKDVRKAGLLSNSALDALDKIVETRNEFNHSMRQADHVTYCGAPLFQSHSSRYLPKRNRTPSVRRFFIDDAFILTEELVAAYRIQQPNLINSEILTAFLMGDLALPPVGGIVRTKSRDCALEDRCWLERQRR